MINLIKKRGNFSRNLDSLLSICSYDEYPQILKQIHSGKCDISREAFLPKNYNEVFTRQSTGNCADLYKLLYWRSLNVGYFNDEISMFVRQKEIFDFQILTGDYENASKTINYIEENIGYSLWSLKNRIMLANMKKINMNEYIDSLNIDESCLGFAYLYAHFVDENCNLSNFYNKVVHISRQFPTDFANYFLYSYSNNYINNDNCIDILNISGSISIVDAFLALKHVLHTEAIYKGNYQIIEKCVLALSKTGDKEIAFLDSHFKKRENESTELCSFIIDAFSKNRYNKLFEQLFDGIKTVEDCSFVKLYICAMACVLNNEELDDFIPRNNLEKIFGCIYNVIKLSSIESHKIYVSELRSLSRILKGFDISFSIDYFLENNLGNNSRSVFDKCFSTDDAILYKQITSLVFPPVFFESLDFYLNANKCYEDIKSDFALEKSSLYHKSLYYVLYYVALKNADYSYALEIYSKCISVFYSTIFRFEVEDLCKYVYENITIYDKITIYDLIFSFSINEFKDLRETVFKNFIDTYNIEKPLDIVDLPFEPELIKFFLYNICDMDTMSSLYLVFETTNDVENYRIEIFKYLISIDSENKNKYANAISNILREQEVKKLKKDVDNSKLSISYDNIRESVFEDFIELTKKYYLTPPNLYEFVDDSSIVASSVDTKSWNFTALSRNVIIENMFKTYATEFCYGPQGLDTYLSTRVRHGTFQKTITKVIIENNLFSVDNNFFKSMISKGLVSEDIKEIIDKFRIDVNNLILRLTNQTFKVFIENVIDGALFDYNMNILDFEDVLYSIYLFKHQLSVADFIDVICRCMINKTNDYLKIIREEELEDLKTDILYLLDNLNNDVKTSCVGEDSYLKIRDKISKCKTNIQIRIDEIKNWFYLSESAPVENYSFDKMINVLNKTMQQQFDDFSEVNINVENDVTDKIKGTSFVFFYDMLQILLSNAMIHSHFKKSSDLFIDLKIKQNEENIIFIIENNICCEGSEKKSKINSTNINDIFVNNKYMNLDTHKEGGMGLIKIMDMMFNVLKIGNNFSTSCENSHFSVTIEINRREVIANG